MEIEDMTILGHCYVIWYCFNMQTYNIDIVLLMLEDIIELVKTDDCQHFNSSLKRLRVVLKSFASYSKESETLPPPTLIPVCLFSVPDILRKLLGLQEDDFLQEVPEKAGLRICVQTYLKGLLKLLGQCDQQIKHVVVQSMAKSAFLTPPYEPLARKWLKELIKIWATSTENLNLGLRCFVAFEKLMRNGSDEFYMWGLRRIYVGFFEHCGQVTWRTLEHINFMANCFCQIIKMKPERAYYVLFGYVRTLAVQVQSLNGMKGKQKAELATKLYSQQMIQIFRLLVQVVGKSGEQLSALVFPLSELINAYEHISQSPEYLPLKLHLVKVQLQLMEFTGVYIPHVLDTLLKILKSAPLQRKSSRKAGVQGSIDLGYRLSLTQLKNTNVINDLFGKAVFYIYWLHSITTHSLAGPEIARQIAKHLLELEFGFKGYKKDIKMVAKLLKGDSLTIEESRRKRKLALVGKDTDKFETFLGKDKLALEGKEKYKTLLEENENILRAKVLAQHEDQEQDESQKQQAEDEDELQSGWQQASEGASEFEQPQQEKQHNQEEESISYEGDPEDADEAAKQWSQHEWSSQEEYDQ